MPDTAELYGTLSRDAYEELPGINWSILKHCIDHPSKALQAIKSPKEPTSRMVLGTAVHCAVLEGLSMYYKRFSVAPNVDRRTKDGKEKWKAFEALSEKKRVITADDSRTVRSVASAISGHPACFDLLKNGTPEAAVRWEMCEGLYGKGIIDWLPDGDGPLVDLKTTRDASPSGFARQIANYRYHGQAEYYRRAIATLRGEAPRDFVIIAVEVEPPYCIGVYRLNEEALEAGSRMVDMAIDRWLAASRGDNGYDPHYTDYIEDLGIPTWALSHETANVVA